MKIMLMTVEHLKSLLPGRNETDEVLGDKLQALELLIRKYTNNNFQKRFYRSDGEISGGILTLDIPSYFTKGDTIQITRSSFNDGLYVIESVSAGGELTIDPVPLIDDYMVLVTRIEYPKDIIMGAVNMFKWDLESRDKVGVKSESLSRHSVTYYDMDSNNSLMGYPSSLLGFLKPYMKARF